MKQAMPAADLLYMDYVVAAFRKVRDEKIDAPSALRAVEVQAIKDIQAAAASRRTLNVATPVPDNTPAGKVTLKFDLGSFVSPVPNRQRWDKVIQDFVAQDAQVGQITLTTNFDPVSKAILRLLLSPVQRYTVHEY